MGVFFYAQKSPASCSGGEIYSHMSICLLPSTKESTMFEWIVIGLVIMAIVAVLIDQQYKIDQEDEDWRQGE